MPPVFPIFEIVLNADINYLRCVERLGREVKIVMLLSLVS
jgi:hypothetical protein